MNIDNSRDPAVVLEDAFLKVPLVFFWMAAAILMSLFLIFDALQHDRDFIDKPIATVMGTVQRTDLRNHSSVYYTYSVEGRTYNEVNAGDEHMWAGGPVLVFYRTDKPSISTLRYSKNERQQDIVWGPVGGLLGSFVFTLGLYLMRKRMREKKVD